MSVIPARTAGLLVTALLLAPCGVAVAAPAASAPRTTEHGAAVTALPDAVYEVVHPDGRSLHTTSEVEAAQLIAQDGWTERHEAFRASTAKVSGTVPIYRLYAPNGSPFLTPHRTEADNAVAKLGYRYAATDADGTPQAGFHAWSTDQGSGAVAVHRLSTMVAGQWRWANAVKGSERFDTLINSGWTDEGRRFWASPAQPIPPENPGEGDGTFGLVVIPDTQIEAWRDDDQRMRQRVSFLSSQREALDLRAIVHTGDVVDTWYTEPNNGHYQRMDRWLAPLKSLGLPTILTVGNHDTLAVGEGTGSANPDIGAVKGLRITDFFNNYFTDDVQTGLIDQYEPNKIDNAAHAFEAEGRKWLVINLELYPRAGAVAWANEVVAAHPDHNVIIAEHHYLDGNGSINGSGAYGEKSAQYVFDNLVRKHANIRLVLSGHTGQWAERTDTGDHGNKIVSLMANLNGTDSPVRVITIDVEADTIDSVMYGSDQLNGPVNTTPKDYMRLHYDQMDF
ncbi:metallophosphoesterase [Propionibacteriaceae bacterium Y1685]